MPRISYFLGIAIYMYHDEHNPPHFHVVYNEYGGIINIKTGNLIAGELPKRILSLVEEWRLKNEKRLLEDWELALQSKKLFSIDPLV